MLQIVLLIGQASCADDLSGAGAPMMGLIVRRHLESAARRLHYRPVRRGVAEAAYFVVMLYYPLVAFFVTGCARGDNESGRVEYFRVPRVPSRRADHRARHYLFRCGVPQVMREPERMGYTNRWQVSQGSAVSRCNFAIAATDSIRLGSLFADVADAPAYRAAGHVIGRVGDEQGLQARKTSQVGQTGGLQHDRHAVIELGAEFDRCRRHDGEAADALAPGERQVCHNPAMAFRQPPASLIA